MKDKDILFPFQLIHDIIDDEWCIFLEDPENKDNFVVVFRDKIFKNCEPVCEALNNIFQKHAQIFANDSIKRKINSNDEE